MMQTSLPSDFMTVRQVAALFHLGEKSVLSRIKDGRLPAHKMDGGKQWLIRREDAQATLRGQGDAEVTVPPTARRGVIRRTHTQEGRVRAIAMLHRLRGGDFQEQTRTWEFLKTALDEDRPSSRKLFSEQGNDEQDGAV